MFLLAFIIIYFIISYFFKIVNSYFEIFKSSEIKIISLFLSFASLRDGMGVMYLIFALFLQNLIAPVNAQSEDVMFKL